MEVSRGFPRGGVCATTRYSNRLISSESLSKRTGETRWKDIIPMLYKCYKRGMNPLRSFSRPVPEILRTLGAWLWRKNSFS